jgi:HEAT repeat protein
VSGNAIFVIYLDLLFSAMYIAVVRNAAKIVALIALVNVLVLAQRTSVPILESHDQELPRLLSRFESEHEVSSKERLLLDITVAHPDAGASLLEIAEKTKDNDTKWLAIRGIGWLKYDEAMPFLKQCLKSKSIYVRSNSAAAIGRIKDPSAAADPIELLRTDADSGVVEQTSLAPLSLGAKQAIPILKTKADNPSPQTRCWVLGAIGALGSKKDVAFEAGFLSDDNNLVA